MNYDPPSINSNIFNVSYFTDLDGSLSLAAADLRYLKLTGGVVHGLTTFSNSLNVIGTLSINSSPVDLSLISDLTAGTPLASKVLSLDASSNINGNINIIGNLTASIINSSEYKYAGSSMLASSLTAVLEGTCSANKALIVDSSRNITNINSLSTTSLIVNSVSISSSDLSLISGITPGTCSASKAVIVDSNKDISGLNIIKSNGIVLTPTNYTLTSPNINGCLWRSNSSRISGFREIDSNNFSWGYSGGGVWNDIVVMSNSTYRITVNGDFNYTGSLRSSGTVVLDSSRNLTCNSASVRNNSQTSGTRVEYLSIGRESGSDYGAWSFQSYYQSATSQQANYCTFTPSLKTSLTSGYGICFNQSGQVSFQDVNSGSGSGGIKTASNIVGCVDIYGGVSRTIGAGHGYLQANSGSPAAYNASSVSTRIGLYVENSIWTSDRVYSSSDRRLKRDIKQIPLDEAKNLLNINAVSYRWKKDVDDRLEDIGFIAQDLIDNGLDKLVSFCPNNDKVNFPKGYSYGLEYTKIVVYQNELIKDLYVQIEELKNEILLLKDTTKKILSTSQKRLP